MVLTTDYRDGKKLPLPPLRDRQARVRLQVCGYAMRYRDFIAWADKQQLSLHKARLHRQDDALHGIAAKLPTDGPRIMTLVSHKENGQAANCFVVGSNKTLKDLEMAQDPERIRKFQEALMTDEPPQWYRLRR
jgi:hypothetical protein